MAVDLSKNDFWVKKIRKECEVRDTNKDGFISRSDFDLLVQHYKEMGISAERLKVTTKAFANICDWLGLEDPNTKLTYEEFISNMAQCNDRFEDFMQIFEANFDAVDSDGNGVISIDEWVSVYKAAGIDTKYAKPAFEAMDTDGNGVITRDEFLAFNKEFYFTAEDKLKSSIIYGPLD